MDALGEEWRDIIAAKSALFSYTRLEKPTVEARCRRWTRARTCKRPTPRRVPWCAILQSFYALRETFLEELGLEEPDSSAAHFRRTQG